MRLLLLLLLCNYNISGKDLCGIIVDIDNNPIPFAGISIYGSNNGVTANEEGKFIFTNFPEGNQLLVISSLGFLTVERSININTIEGVITFYLKTASFKTDEIVITGTRSYLKKTETPIIVNVISNEKLLNLEACDLSQGLNFQTGLRVENDCQTCNYTQLRMNGLSGNYSQILINGKSLFSPLISLYGLEQIPSNIVESIEIVKGGNSSLYGSSAIAGTVNIITKSPEINSLIFSSRNLLIDAKTPDLIYNINSSFISNDTKFSNYSYIHSRNRQYYDNNGDNYSELPMINNKSFGSSLYFNPSQKTSVEINLSNIYEYRYGGEMVDKPAYLSMQSEEREHNILLLSTDISIDYNNFLSISTFGAFQKTRRNHYTGIRPEVGTQDDFNHLLNSPYGKSTSSTLQAGIQFDIDNLLTNRSDLIIGTEILKDNIIDVINAYEYSINQQTLNLAMYLQSFMEMSDKFNLLSGVRIDYHNIVKKIILNPRISILYKNSKNMQIRGTLSTGFRAPQAFDTDLHMAFAGGGVSRINISEDLKEEKSKSLSFSVNYDELKVNYIYGFTLECFFTRINDIFYLHQIREDNIGILFEKRNGDQAIVHGVSLDSRLNYDRKIQFESGLTLQNSFYNKPIIHLEGLDPIKEFLKTPKSYGYSNITIFPESKFNTTVSLLYTGTMKILHNGGSPEQEYDEYVSTDDFFDFCITSKYKYKFDEHKMIEIGVGIKNILNQYQTDFDSLKNRDSNYVYGPSLPRSYLLSIRYIL